MSEVPEHGWWSLVALASSVWFMVKLLTAQLGDKKLVLDDLSGDEVLCGGDSDNDRNCAVSLITHIYDLYL